MVRPKDLKKQNWRNKIVKMMREAEVSITCVKPVRTSSTPNSSSSSDVESKAEAS